MKSLATSSGIGTSANKLARQIGLSQNRISQIIQGKRAIIGDTDLLLGYWFGNEAQFWINLQESYELRRAEAEHGAEIDALPVQRSAI